MTTRISPTIAYNSVRASPRIVGACVAAEGGESGELTFNGELVTWLEDPLLSDVVMMIVYDPARV